MIRDDAPRVSVIITAHAEKAHWLRRAIKSVTTQQDAPDFELILILDKPTNEVVNEAGDAARQGACDFVTVFHGDLGESRNEGVRRARGKYIAFLDGDDLFGSRWLRQAYEYARMLENELAKKDVEAAEHGAQTLIAESFVLHPEYNIFFGAQNFMHRHIGDDSPEFDAKDLVQFNAWSALAFAPSSVFQRFPYARAANGCGYEDYDFNVRTLGAGVAHRCVPGSAHMIRMKLDDSSMATRYVGKNLVIPAMPLFDRRDLPSATGAPPAKRALPQEVISQVVFAHRDVGERQILLTPQMTIRRYPRARTFDDQAQLRDVIGDAGHVVLTDTLQRGGAEKYAIDWARAVGAVLIETSPADDGAWRERARAAGVKVITWARLAELNDDEQCLAIQRALIQSKLRSLLVCNSRAGWALVHQNAEPLAKRVIAASFATIPAGGGMEVCPPFFLKEQAPNLTILTDNDAHAARVREYNGANVLVLPPKCDYSGPSKRKQIDTKRLRVLWAGRGSPEKNPGVLPALAGILEDRADIHVWGDVKPMNGPENLKYRGPFDGFAAIDGTYDVYLITSLTEGCPNTAMEAVMADIPVVGPEIGALPVLATMHYRGDPTAMAQAILHAPEKYTAAPKLLVQKWRDDFDINAKLIAIGDDGELTAPATTSAA